MGSYIAKGDSGTAHDMVTQNQQFNDTLFGGNAKNLSKIIGDSQDRYNTALGTANSAFANLGAGNNFDYTGLTNNINSMLTPHGVGPVGFYGNELKQIYPGSSFGGFQNFAENGGLNSDFWNTYNKYQGWADTALGDFQSLYDTPVDPQADKSFRSFIDTGGYSPTDVQNIRSRSISPLLSTYASANEDMDRNRALQGGYSPNVNATSAKMARELGSTAAQASTNVEAQLAQDIRAGKQWGTQNLAQLVQSGKIAGAQGVAQVSEFEQRSRLQVQQLDDEMKMQGLQGMNDVEKTRLMGELTNANMQAQASIASAQVKMGYRTTNAQLLGQIAGMQTGDQLQRDTVGAQGAMGMAGLTGSQLQNYNNLYQNTLDTWSNSRNSTFDQLMKASQVPSNFSQGLGNISGLLGLGGQIGGMISGLGSLGKKSPTAYTGD